MAAASAVRTGVSRRRKVLVGVAGGVVVLGGLATIGNATDRKTPSTTVPVLDVVITAPPTTSTVAPSTTAGPTTLPATTLVVTTVPPAAAPAETVVTAPTQAVTAAPATSPAPSPKVVKAGQFCSPAGARGVTTTGLSMVCSSTNAAGVPYAGGQSHWRAG